MGDAAYLVGTDLIYLLVSLLLTVWVARTLQRHGQLFLVDVFSGNTELATAVNRLLVVGFYLVNVGYVTFAIRLDAEVVDTRTALESLSTKVGAAALVLGAMHFANLIVLTTLRRRAMAPARPPRGAQPAWGPWVPLAPQGQHVQPGQPAPAPFTPASTGSIA